MHLSANSPTAATLAVHSASITSNQFLPRLPGRCYPARLGLRAGTWPARGRESPDDQRFAPDQAVCRRARGGRCVLRGGARRDGRFSGPQRRRQDHDPAHPDRLPAAQRRRGPGGRPGRHGRFARRPPPHRLPAGELPALPGDAGGRVPLLGRAEGPGRQASHPAGRRGQGAVRPRRGRPPHHRPALQGLPPAGRAGRVPRARAGIADPRRADHRAGPEPDPPGPRADRAAGRAAHDPALDAHPAGGRNDLPAGADHRQGADRGLRHAREPAVAAARGHAGRGRDRGPAGGGAGGPGSAARRGRGGRRGGGAVDPLAAGVRGRLRPGPAGVRRGGRGRLAAAGAARRAQEPRGRVPGRHPGRGGRP